MSQPVPTYAHWPEGIPQCADLAGEALFTQLAARAAATPDLVAMAPGGATYGGLLDASQLLAGYMQQRLNVRSGGSVLLLLDDCPERAVAVFAVARSGATAVMLAPGCASCDIAAGVAASGALAAIVGPATLARLAPLVDDGTLYGCIVCGSAPARPGFHDLAGALAAGIAPLPFAASLAALI